MKIGAKTKSHQEKAKREQNLLCMWFCLLLNAAAGAAAATADSPFFSSSSWFAYKTVSNAQLVPYFFFFPLFAYSNVLTSWKNNTNVAGELSNIYCVKNVIRNNVDRLE